MSCTDVTAVIDICDEYLNTNKVVVLVLLVIVTMYINKEKYTGRLVGVNSNYVFL